MKKMIALVLALIMALSLLPMTAWAEGEQQLYWRDDRDSENPYKTEFRGDINKNYGFWLWYGDGENKSEVYGDFVPSVIGEIGEFKFVEGTGFQWDTTNATADAGFLVVTKNGVSYRMAVTVNLNPGSGGGNQGGNNQPTNWQTGAALNESTQYVTWPMRDEIYFVNEDTPASFELNVEGKTETFYMLPCFLMGNSLRTGFGSYIDLTENVNTNEVYYAIDFWTSSNGGKDLSPITDSEREAINNLVTSASITLIPVEDSDGIWDWGTKFPDYATKDYLSTSIKAAFGNRIYPVGFKGDLNSLGMWQVKATVTLTNDQVLTTVFRYNVNYKKNFTYDVPSDVAAEDVVEHVNSYIANFSRAYPGADLEKTQLMVNLPAGAFNGLITVPASAPATVQISGSNSGETVLNGSICANNNRTEVFNIRMVGAGENGNGNESANKEKWDTGDLSGTLNYGIYGTAFGMISNCSFTGYRTAVYSDADWYRFGMSNSVFYDNDTALYVNVKDPNGGGVPTMEGNVYINNQCAIEVKKLPTSAPSIFSTSKNIFIGNGKDINGSSGNRSLFLHSNAFVTEPQTTGKAYAAPYYEVTAQCLADLAQNNLATLPLDAVKNQLKNNPGAWIGTVKKYPDNWAVPSFGNVEIYKISANDITNGMTIATINSSDDVAGTIKLKTN